MAGNVIANQPWTMYLTADTIGGNVVSNGGGPGPGQPYVQFPTKENNIRGNLIIQVGRAAGPAQYVTTLEATSSTAKT